ncbi:MAG TPA: CPBP family intramembrane glutamic endopeptidase [Terracidiphilus sp.]|nr:CPBP family intramembrane glutamic endopeptidase [Terracidiphilus sp.]
MSTFPEQVPRDPEQLPSGEPTDSPASDPLGPENVPAPPAEWTGEPEEPAPQQDALFVPAETHEHHPHEDLAFFQSYSQLRAPARRDERIPHFGHLGLVLILVIFGWFGAGALLALGLHMKLWGISSFSQAATDFHYTLASQAAQYVITFAGCLAAFPLIWQRPFFEGIQWNGIVALQRFGRLASAAILCFFVAMINGMLMPGPTNAPIDQLFKAPGAAWVLFAFGVTLAPFFEEMAFRGFLLPTLCTGWDWSVEHFTGAPRRPLDEHGNPNWSRTAMILGSVITSLPFALMHGFQTAWSLGPFLLLIFVSLVLCWVRLSTRSLAASTIVHACYNFMLFSFMLLGTGGFKHLDKM